MSCSASRLVLTPTLLGRDGVLRAYTLVAGCRPGLTLQDWLAETAPDAPGRDRLLLNGSCGEVPQRGLVGLMAPTGCLFGVFGYAVDAAAGNAPVLDIRGPSLSAPMGGRLVPDGVDAAIARLATDLGCTEARRHPW